MKILFVSHAANRSGAPLVLLELLRFLARETAFESTILSARGGPLEPEFARFAAPIARPSPFQQATRLAGASRRLDELALPRKAQLKRVLLCLQRLNERRARRVARGLPRFDLIYANSAASGEAVRALDPVLRRGAKLLVHVHELRWALEQNQPGWAFLRKRGHFFIAASNAVRDELLRQNIAPERVETVYEWTNFSQLQTDSQSARHELREQIGVPENAVLVGGCGTMEARKGADWWIQAAFYALGTPLSAGKVAPALHFVWLGGGDSGFARQIRRDVRAFGLEERVHFLPQTNEPKRFFAGLGAFCLSSREDPFPLVAVEAAAQGVPVVCFAGAGGAPELVGNDAGIVVPWGDVGAMGRALSSLGRDASFRQQLGQNARKRAQAMCDVERNAARVAEILKSVAS
jgi:glycosyltransferase involved in cell wall biosynthesis